MNIADGLFYKENFHVLSSLNIIELDRKILIYYIQNYLRFNEINSFIDLDINKTAEKYHNKTGLKFAIKLYLVDNKLNDFYTKENFIEIKFIQIFTPDDRNRIAIEPMTNPSNSLNFSKENFEKYNIKIKPKQKLYSNFIIEFN